MDMLPLVEKFGFQVALVIFFVWWSYIRERKITDRLDKIVDERLKEGQEDRERMVKAIENNTAVMTNLDRTLNVRPCLAKKD